MSEADSLLTLGGRLIEERDRETYAELVLWLRSLPPQDEMVKLAQMLGFLTLMGKELPTALTEQPTKIDGVREQISALPQQFIKGLDPAAFAAAMSERFRQQLAATGLQDTTDLLDQSVDNLGELSTKIAEAVRPLTSQYAGIGATTATEIEKLMVASSQLRQHNAELIARESKNTLGLIGLLALFLVAAGFVFGLVWSEGIFNASVIAMNERVDQILQKVTAPTPAVPTVGPSIRNKRSTK